MPLLKKTYVEVVIINMSWFGCFLEMYDGWLNSGVFLIRCVSPEWVHDT